MREFFCGWKRKAGVVTLVMACVLTAVWLRSESQCDLITVPFGKLTCIAVASCHGALFVAQYSGDTISSWKEFPASFSDIPLPPKLNGETFELDFNRHLQEMKTAHVFDITWFSHLLGIGFGSGTVISQSKLTSANVFNFPYWSMVLPLTLLSAYLVLSKRMPQDKPLPPDA